MMIELMVVLFLVILYVVAEFQTQTPKVASLNEGQLFNSLKDRAGQRVASAFKYHKISGQTFVQLTEEDIVEILPKMGPRKEFERLRKKLILEEQVGWPVARCNQLATIAILAQACGDCMPSAR